jgi:YidC/Oxa1 family membrane protein insertase
MRRDETPDMGRLILAIALSFGVVTAFHYLYEKPRIEAQRQQQKIQAAANPVNHDSLAPTIKPTIGLSNDVATSTSTNLPHVQAVAQGGQRLKINTPRLHGTLALTGARLDDLTLADYFQQVDRKNEVILLSPNQAENPYVIEQGWTAGGDLKMPDASSIWQVVADKKAPAPVLTPETPVTLRWDNGAGVVFERVMAVDDNYLFTVTQRVINNTDQVIRLHPYGLISRLNRIEHKDFYILHEGPVAVLNGVLKEFGFQKMSKEGRKSQAPVVSSENSTGGWMGITDKYWLTALIPDQQQMIEARFNYRLRDNADRFQVDYLGPEKQVPAKGQIEDTSHFFAGAKEVKLIDKYEKKLSVARFDRAIDFGWFYFMTKPFFFALDFLGQKIGNFGLAIMLFTVILKLAVFPLANKSYASMSQMRKLQPKIMELREKYPEDRLKLQQETMELYKQEKVNPLSGCLPMLIQIPIFFALYKVLFVTIEMRHAPFFGWIQDLSAPDPTTVFNLFGLLPFTPPSFLMIGVWPLVMGLTMWLQMKLSPTSVDPIQAKVFSIMPIMFTFMLASFPSGLVIYWSWSNTWSIVQQIVIMKRHGTPIELFARKEAKTDG